MRDVACGSRFWIVSTRSFVAETALPGEKSTRIMPREDLPDVHTKFPLHDLAAVRLDRIVRTTRGIALVFVNRQALSTGPERHTTVPTTYKITSALGFVPIKAFSAQKCGGTTFGRRSRPFARRNVFCWPRWEHSPKGEQRQDSSAESGVRTRAERTVYCEFDDKRVQSSKKQIG